MKLQVKESWKLSPDPKRAAPSPRDPGAREEKPEGMQSYSRVGQ